MCFTCTNAGREWTGVRTIAKIVWKLASGHHFCRRPTIHVGLIEYDVGSHVCWPGGQHLLLAHHKIGSIEACQFETVAVRDGVGRTGLDTVSAKNAAVVVDVINLGVTLCAADAVLRSVLGGFDINTVRRTSCGAEEASDALLQAVFVALQNVRAPETGFNAGTAQRALPIGIVLDDRGPEHLRKGDAHALGDRGNVLQNRHVFASIPKEMRNVVLERAKWG